jgi:dipeptidyl aminopeptidase/acylaminoacyl peptidase
MKKKFLVFSVAMCFSLMGFAQAKKTGIQVTDLLKIKDVSSIQLSPTEDFAIFSVRSVVDGDRKWEHNYQNQWWIVRFEPSVTYRPLTSGKEGFGQPTISPDGKKILFTRAAGGSSQLFIMHLDGGDPIQLTNLKNGAGSPTWSPDGKKIVFSSSFSLENFLTNSEVNPGNLFICCQTKRPRIQMEQWKKFVLI